MVVVRCRPLFGKEILEKRQSIIDVKPDVCQISVNDPSNEETGRNNPPKHFTFDATYDADSTQQEFYDESAYPLVESVLQVGISFRHWGTVLPAHHHVRFTHSIARRRAGLQRHDFRVRADGLREDAHHAGPDYPARAAGGDPELVRPHLRDHQGDL